MIEEQLLISKQVLVQAWRQELPNFLNEGDSSEVEAGTEEQSLRIRIQVAGRENIALEFLCTYKDQREVHVELVQAENIDRTADAREEAVPELQEEYVRRIHECAQSLKELTKAGG